MKAHWACKFLRLKAVIELNATTSSNTSMPQMPERKALEGLFLTLASGPHWVDETIREWHADQLFRFVFQGKPTRQVLLCGSP
jgi:hypothetical protein